MSRLPFLIIFITLAFPFDGVAGYEVRALEIKNSLIDPILERSATPSTFPDVVKRLDEWVDQGKVKELAVARLDSDTKRESFKNVRSAGRLRRVGWRISRASGMGPRTLEILGTPQGKDQALTKITLHAPLAPEWLPSALVRQTRTSILVLERQDGEQQPASSSWLALMALENAPRGKMPKPWKPPMSGGVTGLSLIRIPDEGKAVIQVFSGNASHLESRPSSPTETGMRASLRFDGSNLIPTVSGTIEAIVLERKSLHYEILRSAQANYKTIGLGEDYPADLSMRGTAVEMTRGGDKWKTLRRAAETSAVARVLLFRIKKEK